jgi:regulator of protease activity HflC (stomatin/prohibitin superfamily)
VNDAIGNPIDIAAVIVWRVDDAAKAVFEVASYDEYVKAQSETALRRMASTHPYDNIEIEEAIRRGEALGAEEAVSTPVKKTTLRDGGDEVSDNLLAAIRTRMQPVGIAVNEARISHLAYSSEIAGTMLRRQAAAAVVAARRLVVRGAVSIVEEALQELEKAGIGEGLDPQRRAAMIANLLVVLVSDREVTPIISTGALDA